MTIISPSLLACDFLNIESELKHFEAIPNIWFHLDIMDGHFVPNLTFGHPIIEMISKKTKQRLDAHFMVTNPDFYAQTLATSGIYNFTFHYESIVDHIALIHFLKLKYPSVGISIKPNTPTSVLTDQILGLVNLVLVMSVEPGFGGQPYISNSLNKVNELRIKRNNLGLNFQIQVDGGINDNNASELISAGADNLVAGSYIFKAGPSNYRSKIESLRTNFGM